MAGIQRSWRRAWGRDKPVWQKTAPINIRRRGPKKASGKVVADISAKRKSLAKQVAASVAVLQLLSNIGLGSAYASNITIDNRTATQVDINGNITNIHTNTFSSNGKNAFNSFKDFSVSQGDIVNLHFSNLANTMTADNLLNYVTGGNASNIDGMLNGIKNGQIGGNVYLLNPSGIMVGSTGVVNVGNLTFSTSSIGKQIDTEKSIASILEGSASGDITIQGKINTVTGATLLGNTVKNSGVIQTGAAFTHDSSVVDFSDIVNANDLQYGTKLAVENGNIVITADDNFENSGTISAHSTSGSDAVRITAPSVKLGGNILTGGASLEVKATDSIKVDNALLSTRQVAEDSTLENIKNGTATGVGKAGNVSLAVNHTTYKDKADININKSVIDAAGTGAADTGGDVSIIASSQDKLFAWAMTGPDATVTVKEAAIKGNNISLQAIAKNDAADSPTFDELEDVNDAKNNDSLDDLKNSGSSIGDTLVSTLGNLRVGASVSNVHAKAEVTLDDKAKLVADKDVQVSTAATSAVESMLFSVFGGAGVAISDAQALTTVKSGAEIIAGNNVDVSAATKNKITMSTKAIPVVAGLTPLNMLVTYADMKSNASAVTEAGSSVDAGGALNVTAGSVKDMTVSASASAAGGYFSAGVAINKSDVNATAEIAGNVDAGKVAVDAKVDTLNNNTWSEASVGDGEPGSGLDLAVDWISNSFGVWVKDKLGLGKPPKKVPPSVGITGAIAVTLSEDDATAKITSKGTNAVKSQGDISVTSEVTDIIRTAAIAQQKQREENNVLNHPTDANKKAAGVSAAVIYGQYNNTADAYIGDNAIVDTKQKLTIDSNVKIPFENNWKDFDKLTTNLSNAFLSSNLGLDKAMFTSWAQASSNGDKGTGSASVDIMNFNNKSNAYIGKGAMINQDDTFNSDHGKNDVSVTAKTDIATLDLSGMLKTPLDDLIQAARDKTDPMLSAFGNTSGGTGVGGSVLVTLEDNTTKAYIDEGAKVKANDLTVDADTTVKNISLGAAGGKAADIGFNGTATANIINNTTYAQVIDADDITAAGDITIDAADNIYNIDAAGGVTESSSVGVGVSIAYNDISRDTKASVSGNLTAGDSLNVTAENTGGIATMSLAGSVTADKPPEPKPNEEDKDPIEFIRYLFAEEDASDASNPLAKIESELPDLASKDTGGDKPQSGISTAGNVSINITDEKAVAFVGGETAGKVKAKTSNIEAKNDSGIYALSGAVAIAANADPNSKGLAGAFMLNKVNETTEAYVKNASLEVTGTASGEGLALKATNDADIVSIAASGGVAPSGKAIAGQVSLNMMDNTTAAYVDNAVITTANDMTAVAKDSADIIAVGGAVAYGGAAGFGASIAANLMDNTTEAYINNSKVVGTSNDSDISVTAEEESVITAVTAAVGASRGSMAGAFSASGNALKNTTKAYISGGKAESAAVDTKGSVAVAASDTAAVTSIAGAGAVAAGGSGVGIGASTSVLVTNNVVSAAIGDNTQITALGQNAGIAVDGITTAGLAVSAKSEQEVETIAAGGAGGGNAGIAGSAVVNVLDHQNKAYIGKNSVINGNNTGAGAAQSIRVAAANTTNVTGLAGALAIGKTAGVGAGVSTEVITTDTEAYIDTGADVKAKNNVIVRADSQENINSYAGGAAGGNSAGIAGAANIHIMKTDTAAYIGRAGDTDKTHANVTADGNVAVIAKDDSTINLIAGSAAYGGNAGIGASVDTNVVTKNTAAYLGDYAVVEANGQGAGVDVENGTFTVSYEDYGQDSFKAPTVSTNGNGSIDDRAITKERKADAAATAVKGVAVSATSQNTIRSVAVGASASGKVAVTGSASVNVVDNTTAASIGKNAAVNQSGGTDSQSVLVAAGSDYFNLGIGGAGAAGIGAAGVGAGADVAILNNTTKAYIDNGAKVAAKKDIDVKAAAKEEAISVAAALGASGEVGVAGAVGANIITNETKAYIGDQAVVEAKNNLAVNAQDDTSVISVAGGAGIGIGTAGVGGSVSATVINKDTAAYIGDSATVDAGAQSSDDRLEVYTGEYDGSGNRKKSKISGMSVLAQSSEKITDVVASGGGGLYAGVAGSAAVNIDKSTTQAYIAENAKINTLDQAAAGAKQSVNVAAVNDVSILSVSGAAGGGAVGVSGGVDIGIVQSDTAAYLGNNAQLNAKDNFALTALADKDISSNVASLSGGGVGVAGSVSVYALGTNLSSDAQSSLTAKKDSVDAKNPNEDNVQGYVDGQLRTDKYSKLMQSYDNENAHEAASVLSQRQQTINLTQAVENTTAVPGGTAAFTGTNAKINVGKNLAVNAADNLTFNSKVGAAALAGVAVGGAVSVVAADNRADAHVGSGTEITAGQDVLINGSLSTGFDVKALAGSAGMSTALAGSGVFIKDDSAAAAYLDNIAKLTAANLSVNATGAHNLKGQAIGGAAAYIGLALSGAVVNGTVDGDTTAYLGNATANNDNTILVSGNIDISADTDTNLTGDVIAPAVGSFAGGAGVVNMKDSSNTKAFIGPNMAIQQADAINISAESTPKVTADATVISGGIGALGASIAIAESSGGSEAFVGEGVEIGQESGKTVGSLTIRAKQSRQGNAENAAATARGGAVGGIAAQGIVTSAKVNPEVKAYTGQDAKISTTGQVLINANANPKGKANSTGINAGGVAVGASTAITEITPVISAAVGRNNTLTADSLTVEAQLLRQPDRNTGEAVAIAAGGGLLVGVNATVSKTNLAADVTGSVGQNSKLTVTNAVNVKANADTKQDSKATAVAAGYYAAGANAASASSNNNVTAYFDKDVTINGGKDSYNQQLKSGIVSVTATGKDDNFAEAKTGVGGVLAGSAAVVTTNTKGTTKAYIDEAAQISADGLNVNAMHTALFNGKADSTYASAVGASGVVVNHTVDTDVLVDVGKADITTDHDVNLRAENISRKDRLGAGNGDDAAWNISAAGGGAISGAAVAERVNVKHDTAVTVGTGASITAGTDTSKGSFAADASSDITVHDKARINTGGAISAAVVDSRINAEADTKVTIGDTAQIYSKNGTIKAGTKGSADLDNRVAVDVYGAAGAPAGTAYSNYNGNNTVTIKPNAGLTTDDDDIVLAAGQDTTGNVGTIRANAAVNLWNKTVFPINSKPNPQANVTSNSSLNIQKDSVIGSGQDVYLTADKGKISATYTGVGKDLYREALAELGSAISELFGGGEVNLDIRGGSSSVKGTANVVVNGKVETGIRRVHELTFGGSYQEYTDGDGIKRWRWVVDPATIAGEGKTHTTEHSKAIAESMTDRMNQLYKLKAAYAGDPAATGAYDAEILFLQEKMVAMGLASWNTVGGKKVFVPGLSAGTGALSPKAEAEASLTEMQGYKTSVDAAVAVQPSIIETAEKYRDLVQARDTANNDLTGYINDISNFTAEQIPSDRADAEYKKSQLPAGNPLIAKYEQAIEYYDALAEAKAAITNENSNWNPDIDFATVQAAYDTEKGKLTELTDQQTKLALSIADLETLLSLPASDPNALSDKAPTGPTADFITVNPITAKLGDIKVKADNLTGSGTLFAPGDAKITITNNSPAFLTVNNLIVRDGGSILFNGASVKNNDAINAFNTGKSGANFDVTTKADTDKPAITITSTFDPNAPANKKPLYNAKGEIQGSVALGVAPDITLAQGSVISNVNGPVTIHSAYGSIYANGSINAGTVDIKANNGDFVQSYVDGFNHIGGDPEKLYNDKDKHNGLRPGGITANGNIFISARYLNINGLIKSGIADWDLQLDSDVKVLVNDQAKTLTEAREDYRNNGGTGFYKLAPDPVSGYPGNIAEAGYVSYDAGNDRFEISGVEVHGGYVQLYGQIINTAWDGANTGKVQALDGYGKITITNNSGKDIMLNNLNTGEGTAGIIDITDIQDSAGTAIHTRYTSTRGEVKVERNGEAVEPNIISTENDRSTLNYNPKSGLYYNWTTGQDYSVTQNYHFESKDVFGYTYKSGETPKGKPTSSNPGVPTPLANGIYLSNGRPFTASGNPYYATNKKTIDTGKGEYHLIKERTTRDWYTVGITGTYHQDYSITTPKKDIRTYSVKADNPIGIEFFGYDSGEVNVGGTNTGNIRLKGAISNKEGVTSIAATQDIIQSDSSALITTELLDLRADGNIGSSAQNVRAIIGDTLNAVSAAGDVNVTQVLGNLNLGTVTADTGTLRLVADGSIANAASSDVRGQRVELTSNNGSIGDASTPLIIRTGTTDKYLDADYGLKASALNDINISNQAWDGKNLAGDLLIDTVESRTGNVTLTTPGRMIDNNTEEQIDTRTWKKLTDYWDSLQLRAGEASNAQKQAQTISSYVNGKNADYQTYWQLKDHIVNGQYICTDAEQAALSAQNVNPDDFAASQTAKYRQLDAQGVGNWNDGKYDADFAYSITKAERDSLLKGASWTDRELAISLAPGALKQLTDTNPIIKAPNVKGKDVTLAAGKGIGSNIALPAIDAKLTPDKLTQEQKVALAAAERADLVLDNVNNVITVTQRKPINIETTGVLNAVAGDYAYLGSEKDVRLDQISAGTDVRLKVGGSILNGAAGNANIIGQNVILEAADGTIGTETAFLQLNQDGTLTARAAKDIFLRKDGDIKLDTLYSLENISLDTDGSIQSDYDNDKVSIMSKSLKLKAKQVGSSAKALGISLADEGALDAEAENDIHINNSSTKLNISQAKTTAGNIDISAGQDMSANNIQTTAGSIKLNSAANLDAQNIKAPGAINLISGKDMVASTVESAIKGVELTAGRNLTVDAVKAAAGNIAVKAGANILNGAGDMADINLTAHNISLTAETGGIGQTDKHVTVAAAGTVTAEAQNDINITGSGNLVADKMSNRSGSINLAVINGSSLQIAETSVADGMNIRSDNVVLDHVVHTGNSMLEMDISGSSKPMAEDVTVNVLSAQGVQFNNLIADKADINAQTDKLAASNTRTGTRTEFTNNYYTVVADNNPPQSLLGSDVLLRPLDNPYDLLMDGKAISTDAKVINSASGISLNGSKTSDTAVTIAEKTIKAAGQTGVPEFGAASLSPGGTLAQGNINPTDMVDITQISNSLNADGNQEDQDETSS
ncbi:MAG: leukotoxin LktA family filamentous adhesin [Negativicutes bacterium]|jgi:filamentous hemagglutinin family protein